MKNTTKKRIKNLICTLILLTPCLFVVANTQNLTDGKNMQAQKLNISVNNQTFKATIVDNQTSDAFIKKLPLTLDMIELNGNEKYYNPKAHEKLPVQNARAGIINAGDLMVWDASYNSLVLFYETFTSPYKYVKIAYVDDATNLKQALGNKNVKVKFELD